MFATALTIGVPLVLVMQTTRDAAGNVIPAWRAFWALFGASNQLLVALAALMLVEAVRLLAGARRPAAVASA